MKTGLIRVTGLTTLALVAACSSTPEVELPSQPIQVVQLNDPNLSCLELQGEIDNTTQMIGLLNERMDSFNSNASMMEAADAVNSLSGRYNPFNRLFADVSRSNREEVREIRDSYQRRRDVLMQQYHFKECHAGGLIEESTPETSAHL